MPLNSAILDFDIFDFEIPFLEDQGYVRHNINLEIKGIDVWLDVQCEWQDDLQDYENFLSMGAQAHHMSHSPSSFLNIGVWGLSAGEDTKFFDTTETLSVTRVNVESLCSSSNSFPVRIKLVWTDFMISAWDASSQACSIPEHNMYQMCQKKDFADFYMAALGGVEIWCHRSVLAAASPVFERMLVGDLQEGLQQFVSTDELASTLEALVEFMYLGTLPPGRDYQLNLRLLELSDYYELPKLFELCVPRVCPELSSENILETLQRLKILRGAGPAYETLFCRVMENVGFSAELLKIVCTNVASPVEDDSIACHAEARRNNVLSGNVFTRVEDSTDDAEKQVADAQNDSAAEGTVMLSVEEASGPSHGGDELGGGGREEHDIGGVILPEQKHETCGVAVNKADAAERPNVLSLQLRASATTVVPYSTSSHATALAETQAKSKACHAAALTSGCAAEGTGLLSREETGDPSHSGSKLDSEDRETQGVGGIILEQTHETGSVAVNKTDAAERLDVVALQPGAGAPTPVPSSAVSHAMAPAGSQDVWNPNNAHGEDTAPRSDCQGSRSGPRRRTRRGKRKNRERKRDLTSIPDAENTWQ